MRISDWSSDVCSSDLIKVLLNAAIDAGELTLKQRDMLLGKMTDEVAELVLTHNYLQSGALSLTEAEAPALLPQHARFIRRLERAGQLNRARSEEHTSELQSLMRISYAVFCLKKKTKTLNTQ